VNQFKHWQSWVILLGLLALALTQLFYLHRGLKLVSTSVLYPLVFCVYNIIAILDGLLYYRQASRLSALHGGLIALGTVILLSGVLALSWRLQDDTDKPAVTKGGSALTPGLGYVGNDLEGSDSEASYHDDIAPNTPLRKRAEDDRLLVATRGRRRALSQVEEIWGELHDDASVVSPRTSRIINEGTEEGGGDAEVNESTVLLHRSPGRRKSFKRNSYGFPRVPTSPSTRKPKQSAMGGWWKLRWWKRRRDGGGGGDSSSRGIEGA